MHKTLLLAEVSMKEKEEIKGSCENCGFAYKGTVTLNNGSFPNILCPQCKKETCNFDDASSVDHLEKTEGYKLDYTESQFA